MTHKFTPKQYKLLNDPRLSYSLSHWLQSIIENPTPKQYRTAVKITELTSKQRSNYYIWDDELVRKPAVTTHRIKKSQIRS